MTIFEVCISATVLAMLVLGILTALLQSRRLTEGSIYQNSAITIVQGYLEQMKNMEFTSLPYTLADGSIHAGPGSTVDEVLTRIDESTLDTLRISTGAIPNVASITPGSTGSTGIIDNDKVIDINQSATTNDDLRLRLWVWIQDLSNSNSTTPCQALAITIIYQYRITNGTRSRWYVGSVRNIRSSVPTF